MTPHIHADLIHQWADGAEIQHANPKVMIFSDIKEPQWHVHLVYRAKPTPVPNIEMRAYLNAGGIYSDLGYEGNFNVKVTFDGTTKKLIAIEMIK